MFPVCEEAAQRVNLRAITTKATNAGNFDATRPASSWACPAARQAKLEIAGVKPVVTRRLMYRPGTPNVDVEEQEPGNGRLEGGWAGADTGADTYGPRPRRIVYLVQCHACTVQEIGAKSNN